MQVLCPIVSFLSPQPYLALVMFNLSSGVVTVRTPFSVDVYPLVSVETNLASRMA